VTAYARAVTAGKILAGRPVRLACTRHLTDLKRGHERGLWFDDKAAAHVLDFFPRFLRLAEGAFAGEPFRLEPWQQFIVGSLFGWKGKDGHRRFRTAYIEVGKGNGKSPLAAGVGLYGLQCDDEASAEIYSAAVTRDQAAILFTDAKKMAEASPALRGELAITRSNIAFLEARSYFRPVSSEARALDGKRVHMALIDEIHEHRSALVVDKMRAGTKGRRQALIFEITNAGYDRHSVCWQHHEYSLKILEGVVEDDGWFAYLCQLDPCEPCRAAGYLMPSETCKTCDDWRDRRVWPKANPNLGVSVPERYLAELVREAEGMPSKQNIVKRLNFCLWTESATRWLPSDQWAACGGAVDPETLRGRTCYGGLDLATTTDLAAFVLLFPPEGEETTWVVLTRAWVPQETIQRRSRQDRVPYDVWAQQGVLEATEGNVVDYDVIRERIRQDAETYRIVEIGFDRWNSSQLVTQLQGDGATMKPVGQGFASMNAPAREFEKLVAGRAFRHGGHPVLAWCAANVCVEQDAAGNIKPSKRKSTERIDLVVALVMALERAMGQGQGPSVYESHGVLAL
jgi:phage terminase large subunit-like protein